MVIMIFFLVLELRIELVVISMSFLVFISFPDASKDGFKFFILALAFLVKTDPWLLLVV